MTAPTWIRAFALVAAAAALTACSSDAPSVGVQADTAASAGAFERPPLSRPPEYAARPDADASGVPAEDDSEPVVFDRADADAETVPTSAEQPQSLSDGEAALLGRAAAPPAAGPDAPGAPDDDSELSPEVVTRLATGGATDGTDRAVGDSGIRFRQDDPWLSDGLL